ncbi:TetR/AcrR family transcriptional regulator [Actinomadura litoris]|uniref:TetR family transcriptional regulator n=1 Tax=Actinomadura litoris TaxID=2678616 RepID=A0A7K1KUJ9_9ACTN|nr:TetR/AcrR family transcriptional regulator [Actinomadura litoris]MUN35864.1 TetR family transcriptional regulator [Actinomadura litoris]
MARTSRAPRADAARNRDKLLAAAAKVFGERGLDAPLEEVARRAEVSIGTLYNHFPARRDLIDAIFPVRLAALEQVADAALAEADPWKGFVLFVEGLFALQARDRGLNDVLARRYPASPELSGACHRGFVHLVEIIERARGAGLREDFEAQDMAPLMWAMSQVIRETADVAPDAWRRFLAFHLDGLRAGAAGPLPAGPLTEEQARGRPGEPAGSPGR